MAFGGIFKPFYMGDGSKGGVLAINTVCNGSKMVVNSSLILFVFRGRWVYISQKCRF